MKNKITTTNIYNNYHYYQDNDNDTVTLFLKDVDQFYNNINKKNNLEECEIENESNNATVINHKKVMHDIIDKITEFLLKNHNKNDVDQIYKKYNFNNKWLEYFYKNKNDDFLTPPCDETCKEYPINIINIILLDIIGCKVNFEKDISKPNLHYESIDYNNSYWIGQFVKEGFLAERYFYEKFFGKKSRDKKIIVADYDLDESDHFGFVKPSFNLYHAHDNTYTNYGLKSYLMPMLYTQEYSVLIKSINKALENENLNKRYNNFIKAGILPNNKPTNNLKLIEINNASHFVNNKKVQQFNDNRIAEIFENLNVMAFYEIYLCSDGSDYEKLLHTEKIISTRSQIQGIDIYSFFYRLFNKQGTNIPFKSPDHIEGEKQNRKLKKNLNKKNQSNKNSNYSNNNNITKDEKKEMIEQFKQRIREKNRKRNIENNIL